MSKHTPGPWEANGLESPPVPGRWMSVYAYPEGGGFHLVASIEHAGVGLEQARHNARLVAAAPDLLDALQRLVGDGTRFCDCEQPSCAECHAHAVIRKAQGKTP